MTATVATRPADGFFRLSVTIVSIAAVVAMAVYALVSSGRDNDRWVARERVRCEGVGATLHRQLLDPDLCARPDGTLREIPRG